MKCPKCELTDKTITIEMAVNLYTTNSASLVTTDSLTLSPSSIGVSHSRAKGSAKTETQFLQKLPNKPIEPIINAGCSMTVIIFSLLSLGYFVLVGLPSIFVLFINAIITVIIITLMSSSISNSIDERKRKFQEDSQIYENSWVCLRDGHIWVAESQSNEMLTTKYELNFDNPSVLILGVDRDELIAAEKKLEKKLLPGNELN